MWRTEFKVISSRILILCSLASVLYGTAVHAEDSGLVWAPMTSGPTNYLLCVWGTGPSDLFVVESKGIIEGSVIWHYDGIAWSSTPTEVRNFIHRLWGTASDDVYALADDVILHYDGTVWSKITNIDIGMNVPPYYRDITVYYRDIWGTGPDNIFIAGYAYAYLGSPQEGVILHYDGSDWSCFSIPSFSTLTWPDLVLDTSTCSALWGTGTDNVFVLCHNKSKSWMMRYDGTRWRKCSPMVEAILSNFWGTAPDDLFAVGTVGTLSSGYEGTIWHYNGTDWARMPNGTRATLNGLWGTGSSNVFAVGYNGKILHYDGSVWSAMTSGTSETLQDIWGCSEADIFAVGSNGTILHYGIPLTVQPRMQTVSSSASTASWPVSHVGPNPTNWSAAVIDGGDWATISSGAAGTDDGTITVTCAANSLYSPRTATIRLTAEGMEEYPLDITLKQKGIPILKWSYMKSPSSYGLVSVWGSGDADVFAVGSGGTIFHYNGDTWSAMTSGTTQTLMGVWGSGSGDIFAVGYNGVILHYDGTAWSTMTSGMTMNLFRVWGTGPNDVYAVGSVGYDGTVLHYDGVAWLSVNSETTNSLYGIWGTASNNYYIMDVVGQIRHYDGIAWNWMSTVTKYYMTKIWGSGPNDIFMVGSEGTIEHYDGNEWSLMASGTTQTLYDVWGTGPNDVYAVGGDSTILHYDGAVWSAMKSVAASIVWGIWGTGSKDLYAVTSSSYILHYGLPLNVQPKSQTVSEAAGTVNFSVSRTRTDLADWSAALIKGGEWASITSGSGGTDKGTISVSYAANPSYRNRTATIRIVANGATDDPLDVTIVQAKSLRPGDANGDGAVDASDLGILAANYGQSSKTWFQGDFNNDGAVDVGDLGILAANYGKGAVTGSDFEADYAKVFGAAAAEENDSAKTAAISEDGATADSGEESVSTFCSGLGLTLMTGMIFLGVLLVRSSSDDV